MKKEKILNICIVICSVIVIILSMVDLLTGKMIPGLNPFCVAGVMILMSFHSKIAQKIKFLFYISAGMNIIAGISQVVNAFVR